ncbi:hypothetical protein NEIELOOT_02513 [Neisseria elongata subsp. glycolytica ATCC 29315]|uniref:EamA domain-containing protein n=1 Tax=Neisseria elongata subsp. glycolytica ATCC 29315 TaxID=546263 RepID=D4DTV7_NEIEG|nr:hypothetical protein NEIELOOT_02513 [Neisseria elongata subsp. glycolytica ATCC 29315]
MKAHNRELLGSAWMIAAALFFTLMNLCIKAAHQKFGMGSGELVFWRMLFAAVVLGGLAKLQGKPFPRRTCRATSTAASSAQWP